MAHFAELDKSNNVLRVIVIHNQDCQDESGNERETVGQLYCKLLFGENSRWLQTSYNGTFRGKYAGIGDMYDDNIDEFVTPASPGIIEQVIKIEE